MKKFPIINTNVITPTVSFVVPRDQINLNIELPNIARNQGWGCGTYFNVQFLEKIGDKNIRLLASALYVVTYEDEILHTSEDNPYQPITKNIHRREVSQIGDWWTCDGLSKLEGENVDVIDVGSEKTEPGTPYKIEPKVIWNPGKKKHQVKIGDQVVFESQNKEEAKKFAIG